MATVGAVKYNVKPNGYGRKELCYSEQIFIANDKIPMDTFAEEALTGLRKL